jgi:hypothetical protein
MSLRHAAALALLASALALGCADPAKLAAQRQAQAAQQQAQAKLAIDTWLSSSPEGSSAQLQSDWNVRNGLSDLQKDALKDETLGVQPTAEEQKALDAMTQDQKRAIARLTLMEPWLKQQSAEMQQQLQFQQALQVQEEQAHAQREQAQLLCYQQMRGASSAVAFEVCNRY